MLNEAIRKKVLFIGGNYFPEPTGIGKFNGELIDFFALQGFGCTVLTTYPYYPYWKVQAPYQRHVYRYKKEFRYVDSAKANPVEIFRCPHYVPANPTASRRILLDFTFFVFSFFKLLHLFFRPRYDFVIAVVPGFQIGLLGLLYKFVRGGKFIYHIQDLQIDTARELKLIRSKFLLKLLFKTERFILKKADIVSSISAGMIRKIQKKCNRQVLFLPNWVDTKSFYPLTEREKLKVEYKLHPQDKVILYSGAIGEKQGLECILDTATMFQDLSFVKFVICGSGPYKERLEQMSQRLGLHNVIFFPTQPTDKLNRFLNMADMHLVLQKADASDLVMPSKLTTIFSVGGVAIITAVKNSNLYGLVSDHDLGLLVEPENQHSLTEAIRLALKKDLGHMKTNAREYAETFLSSEMVFPKLLSFMQQGNPA